jgi:hypothetical protein
MAAQKRSCEKSGEERVVEFYVNMLSDISEKKNLLIGHKLFLLTGIEILR